MNDYKIYSILVSYNPDIDILLTSLNSMHTQVEKIILVDNSSNNSEKIEEIQHKFTNIHFIKLDKNIGLAQAQNIGIQYSLDEKVDYVILFDQDSIISKSFINNLVSSSLEIQAKKDTKIAAIGPIFYDPMTMSNYPATIYSGPFIKRINIKDEPIQATFIIASGSLISASVLRDIGKMKNELFIDYIDVEWCLRAKNKGYSVYITPHASMAHTIGDRRIKLLHRTISVHSPLRRYYLIRNSIIISKINYIPIGYKIRELFFNPIRFAVSLYTSKEKLKVIKYTWFAILDGIKGISGPFKH
ncbi:rhamnosyltransferase [Proteus sp. G2658]|uniref:Gt3 n=1 Tax=Proteus penneri TaxID=102862 RepID=A0A385JNQ8_9GAMM|nr:MULTISPECIES: rhamnosyltransferase [Proteus]AXY99992.1 gt3 [Proteus penneri]NBM91397.1 rhamnosyltransferase [Proteus sp. G2658]